MSGVEKRVKRKVHLILPDDMLELLERQVRDGKFVSVSEAVRYAIRTFLGKGSGDDSH